MSDVREIKKLSEVCDFQNGFAFKSNKFKSDGLPILRISNIQNNHISTKDLVFFDVNDYKEDFERYKVLKNDIIIAMSGGTTGKIGINQTDNIYYLNQRVGKFSPKKNLDRQYLFYFLHTKSEESLKIAGGAAQPNLSTEQIKNFQIPVPSITKQRTIVAKLDQAFAAIDQAKANIEKNIANAKELFQSKLNKIFSGNEGIYTYELRRFDDICILQRGFDLPTQNRITGDYPLVSSNGITDRISEYKVNGPGVVTGRSGSIGNVHYISENYWPLNTSLYIKDFIGNNEKYIYYFLKSIDLKKYSSGAGVPTLNRNFVHKDEFLVVTNSLDQQRIASQLDQLQEQTNLLVTKYQQKLANLEELKKSILEKAFKGELSIAAIEKV